MIPPKRILLVCDNPQYQEHISTLLTSVQVTVSTFADVESHIAAQQFSLMLVITDHLAPALSAVTDFFVPFIVVCPCTAPASIVRAMKAGAVDYMVLNDDIKQTLPAMVQDYLQSAPIQRDDFPPALLRNLYDSAPVMMFILDSRANIIDINQCCLNELSYTRSQIIGQPAGHLLTDASYQRAMQVLIPQLQRTGAITDAQYQMRTSTGDIIDVVVNCRIVHANGQDVWLCIVQNMTEQYGVIAAEQQQRALTEALRDTTVVLTSTLDFDEVLNRILENVARVVPYDSGNVMLIQGMLARVVRNKRAGKPNHEQDLPTADFIISHMPTLHTMMQAQQAMAIPDTSQSSDWVALPQSDWVQSFVGAPILDRNEVIGFLTLNSAVAGTFTAAHAERLQAFANQAAVAITNARLYDAVQRHADELEQRVMQRTAQLNVERNQLYAILQSTGEGIFYVEDSLIRYVNPALLELTGYTADELIDQPVTILCSMRKWQGILDTIANDEIWRGDMCIRCKDGSTLDAGLTAGRGDPQGASPKHLVVIVRDIRREKALQNQKARFIANASHELRTPIQNIITRLYLIKKQPARINDHIEVVEEVTRRMRHLVEDLLDLSRFERGRIPLVQQPVNLAELINATVTVQQAEASLKKIALITRLEQPSVIIQGDSERLGQVLTNLVSNALNYTPEGGRVIIRLQQQDKVALIHVEDTGVGIAPHYLEQIFEPFVRVHEDRQGSGLGLSIAREIIEMHNGRIDVTSKPGHGSCFTITLQSVPVAVGHNQ